MADFCKQCSIELMGEDFGDHSRPNAPPLAEGMGWPALCEGCGPTLVDNEGACMYHEEAGGTSDACNRKGLGVEAIPDA